MRLISSLGGGRSRSSSEGRSCHSRGYSGSGYSGAYTPEVFSKDVPGSLWKTDLFAAISDSRVALKARGKKPQGTDNKRAH
ncbi:MAG: hypothetical protein ACR2GU_08650 [Rubrobacteraceae bacterium]